MVRHASRDPVSLAMMLQVARFGSAPEVCRCALSQRRAALASHLGIPAREQQHMADAFKLA
jgi:hypothetical protein